MFVEAHTPGQDDWTTLPDANGPHQPGYRARAARTAGPRICTRSCDHYQTLNGRRDLLAEGNGAERPRVSGTSGTGRSSGWEQWEIDLSDYAGQEVELSISYASDYAVQGLGVFLDDIVVTPASLERHDLVRG